MKDPVSMDARVMAYVDGELDAEAAAEVERLIATDPDVRADVEMFRNTAMLLRAACGEQQYADTSPRPATAATRPEWIERRRVAIALAAGVLLTLGGFGGGVWWTRPPDDDLLDEVAEYHAVISRETVHLAEVPADHAAEFVDWMSHRLERRLSVPDLQAAGLRYAGGRMLIIDDSPVADFLYTRVNGAPIGVCVVRGGGMPSPLRVVARGALRLATWAEGGVTYIVVGDLDAATARRIAALVASQQT